MLTSSSDSGPIMTIRRPNSGLYSVRESALYLRATTPPPSVPLKMWMPTKTQFIGPSSRHLYAWIRRGMEWGELGSAPRDEMVLDFVDLIRLRMVVILRSRGIPHPVIRRAEDEARKLTGSPQPFVTEQLWTSASDVFLRFADFIIALDKGGQLAMEFLGDFLTPVNHGMTFDANDVASAWRPSEGVLIDPAIQFGDPCLEGTRIATDALWAFYQAGDSVESIARAYGIDRGRVTEALRWEGVLERAA